MTNKLSNVLMVRCIALLMVPACSVAEGEPAPSGSGSVVAGTAGMGNGTVDMGDGTVDMGDGTVDMGNGTIGNPTQTGSAGTPAEPGGAGSGASNTAGSGGFGTGGGAGTGGSFSSGGTGGTAPGTGGAGAGTGGLISGGTGGTAPSTGGASGGGGTGGSGGAMGEPVMRPSVDVAGTVPSQYGNPVANPGEWTPNTYPVYFYTTQNSGLSEDDTLERQSTPIMKQCNVYTPPDYDPEVEYPLILVLHGITDNHNTWMERGNPKPDVLLDNLITSEIIEPVIAVFAQGDAHENWASHDTFSDTVGYFVFGDELMNDLIPYIEANYSVKKDRNFRAFSGFSFGGRQTVNVGLSHHLKDFAWFGAFGLAGGAYGSTQIAQYLETQDVTAYPLSHFYAMAGNNDSFGANDTVTAYERDLPGAAPSITSENFTTQVVSGAHDYPTVTIGLYNFLRIAFGIIPE